MANDPSASLLDQLPAIVGRVRDAVGDAVVTVGRDPRGAGLVIADGRVRSEERLLLEKRWRVRAVQMGPDGFLYLGVQRTADGGGGVIARLRPVDR